MAAAMKKPNSLIDPSSTSIFPICHSLRVEASTDRGCLGHKPRPNSSECVNRPEGSCPYPNPGIDRLATVSLGDHRLSQRLMLAQPLAIPGHTSGGKPLTDAG